MTKIRTISINVGSTLLALAFVSLGLVKLINPALLGALATWGYPEAFRVGIAVVEIGGGLLLLVPRVAWYGAGLLATLLAGAAVTHFWNGQGPQTVLSAVLFAPVALLGYVRHPRAFAVARLRAVVDAFAERELAQERQRLASQRAGSR